MAPGSSARASVWRWAALVAAAASSFALAGVLIVRLPDGAFADQNDHLRTQGLVDGASAVARQLLPLVRAACAEG